MRQEQAIRAFRKGLENAINQLTATSYSAIFGFIEPGIVALNDIQLKKDADAETLAEIEALKNKLVAIANSADKLWMNLSSAQDRLVGALRSMNNLSSELIAHADVNKDVFADSEARTMKDLEIIADSDRPQILRRKKSLIDRARLLRRRRSLIDYMFDE